LNYTRKPADSQ